MNPFASRFMLAALVGVNALLVGALVFVSTGTPRAHAAIGGTNNYSMVVGQSLGAVQETVYVVDTDSGKVVPVVCNPATRKLDVFAGRDLNKDINANAGGGPRPK